MRRAGFTLIEIILAVAILSLMMVLAYSVVMSTVLAQKRIEAVMLSSEIGPVLIAQIREDLEGAFIPDGEEGTDFFAGLDRDTAAGGRDRIDFITSRMSYGAMKEGDPAAFHSVNEVGYQVGDNDVDGSVGILYRRIDHFIDEEPTKGGRLVELYDRVVSFNVSFLREGEWVETWSSLSEAEAAQLAQGTQTGQQAGSEEPSTPPPGQEKMFPEAVRVELTIRVKANEEEFTDRTYLTTITYPQSGGQDETTPGSTQNR